MKACEQGVHIPCSVRWNKINHMKDINIILCIFFVMFRLVDFCLNFAVRSLLSSLSVTMRAPVGGPVKIAWCKTDSGI